MGALSGGPLERRPPPWGGRAVRRFPRRGSRTTRPLGCGQSLSWKYVTSRCAHALATTYLIAAGALRVAHGVAIVGSVVDTLAWVIRGAGAVLRDSSSPRSASAEHLLVDTTPGAIGYQMASLLEGHGQRVAAGPAAAWPAGASAVGGSSRAPYAGEPAGSAVPYHGGGVFSSYGRDAAAGAAPSRMPRSSSGTGPSDRGSASEYPGGHSGYDQFGWNVRDNRPHSPGRE